MTTFYPDPGMGARTGGDLIKMLLAFQDTIPIVTEDGKPAYVKYRITTDGDGVLVVGSVADKERP